METSVATMKPLVIGLGQIIPGDADRVGRKAATLAELRRAGFSVPEGAVLTTDVAAVDEPEIGSLMIEVLQVVGDGPLAVRSSGVAEDLEGASFAGQYETVLGVRGVDELEHAIRRVWESAHSAHAAAYGEDHVTHERSMAVLVQRLIAADAAGVAFSANPVTGRRDEVVINAVRGLGERLVSGQASPDEWVVDAGGARAGSEPEGAIDAGQALAIADLVRRVEAHFGRPQDIEWAVTNRSVYLLQARPITALPNPDVEPIPIPIEVPDGFWQHDAGHQPRPWHPIDRMYIPYIEASMAPWVSEFGYLFDGLEFREIGGWGYTRMITPGGRDGPMLPTPVMWLLVRVVPSIRRRLAIAREAVRSDKPGRFIERWYDEWQPELANAIADLDAVSLDALSDDELSRHIDAASDLFGRGLLIHNFVQGAVAPILYELATTCRELLGWDVARALDLVRGTSFRSVEPTRRLHELAEMAKGRPAVVLLLDHADEVAAARLAELDPEFAAAFERYVRDYARRALGEIGDPTLAEMPGAILGMIAGQIRHGYDPAAVEADNARNREHALGKARAFLAGRPSDLIRLERAVERASRAYPAREDIQFFAVGGPIALIRYAVLELGRRLAARGVVADADDVLFLELDEARNALFNGGDHRAPVARRKGERRWALLNPGPASYGEEPSGPPTLDFLPAEARLPMEAMLWSLETNMAIGRSNAGRDQGPVLSGIAASAGRYTGRVRVIADETQFDRIQPGDVLVCRETSPVWSIVFPSLGALVTDSGGILSHPAIIAREYRIPAVVATGNATSRLVDDQIVTVDGTAGVVEPVGVGGP